MIQQFLQKKINELLVEFLEIEKSNLLSLQGVTLKNSKIKPKLVDILSQMLAMPLQLSDGVVEQIKLNVPWQKLFLIKNSSIKMSMQGFKLKTKLRNKFNYTYNSKYREYLIKYLTNKLINEDGSQSPLVKRIKEFFMDTLQLQINDIILEIEVDLQQKIQLIFKIDSVTARQQQKTNMTQISAQKISIGYRVSNSKVEDLLFPTNIVITRQKSKKNNQIVSEKQLKVEKVHFNINNKNFNDIRRFLYLISWHNSFMHLPCTLWREKPLPLIKIKPIQKFRYYAKLLLQKIQDKNIKKILLERRIYINLYTEVLKGNKNATTMQALAGLEDRMYIWKIISYRSFCIQKFKNYKAKQIEDIDKKNQLQNSQSEKDISASEKTQNVQAESKLNGFYWMKSWFRSESNEKQLIQDLEQKLKEIQTIPTVSLLSIHVHQILVNVDIITYSAKQKFFSVKALDIAYNYQYRDSSQAIHPSEKHQAIVGKFKILYDDYLGHHKKYSNLLQMKKEAEIKENSRIQQESQEQFQQVQNFLQFRSFPKFNIKIQPVRVCINHEIIQKFSVFDFEKLQKALDLTQMQIIRFSNPYSILTQMRKSFALKSNPKIEVQRFFKEQTRIEQLKKKQTSITGGIYIIVPQQMARQLFSCNELILQMETIRLKIQNQDQKKIEIQRIAVKGKFPNENAHDYEMMMNMGQIPVKTVTFVDPFSIKIDEKKKDESSKFVQIEVLNEIKISLYEQESVGKLLKMLHVFKPAQKSTRNLHRMRMRRKQSIGEQFIDACQNLNEHIVKSTISMSENKIKTNNLLIQDTKNELKIFTKKIIINLESSSLLISDIEVQKQEQNSLKSSIFSKKFKNVRFQIYDVQKFMNYATKLNETIKKLSPSFENYQSNIDNQLENDNLKKFTEIFVSYLNIEIGIYHAKNLIFNVGLNNISLNVQQYQKSVRAEFNMKYQNHSKQLKKLVPIIQTVKLNIRQKHLYNSLEKQVLITKIDINFTPQVFKFLSRLYKIYLESIQDEIKIENNCLNYLKVNINGVKYLQLKPSQIQTINSDKQCNILVFDQKIQLSLTNQFETHYFTQNCCLIKKQTILKHHCIESNLKIVNLQQKTIWFTLVNSNEQNQFFKNDKFDKYHPAARSSDLKQFSHLGQRSRGLSLHEKNFENDNVNMPLKPNDTYYLLVNNEQKKLAIFDQGISFSPISISQVLKNRQILLKNEDQDEYLVLRCRIQKINQITFYSIQILSPVYIVNKLPWKISYQIGKQALDIQQMVNSEGRVIKKRSLQMVPLQKIMPLQNNKIRNITYRQINDFHLILDDFQGTFKIVNILNDMVKRKGQNHIFEQSTLICLSDGRRNLQLILKIQITDLTLKMKVFPEYVFINLCEMDIFFKIKQSQYTYPQIKLKPIKDYQHMKAGTLKEIQSFLNTYISFGSEKFNEKNILKQLFYDFADKIEIFAGTINKKLKRSIIYECGSKSSFIGSGSGIGTKNSGGYTSGYGSGSDGKQYIPDYQISELGLEDIFYYGPNKSSIYYRNIRIDQYFNLVMFVPTINIINRSHSTFMIKSRATKNLIKVQGNEMNYFATNKDGFSIQALEQNQQVNLNQWFNINILKFGTVYYAKQLGSNGYQSKEYVLRKKKLKKRPKIFYRIVLSKHERGIKILIQQSQYSPISFINKTRMKLKIEQQNQGYEEQLGQNEMLQFACIKRPYENPEFKLYYAEHYEYIFVEKFNVDEFKVIPCSKSSKFVISVEEFKNQKIVVFRDEKLMQPSQIKSQFQIQKTQKMLIRIQSFVLSFMNNCYKQFSALKIFNIQLQMQQKNSKKYFKFTIDNVEGYDYSGIQPKLTFQSLKNDQSIDMFRSTFKIPSRIGSPKSLLNVNIIISSHKNAIIVQKCHIRIGPTKLTINSFLLLQTIKVYHKQILNFVNLLTKYKSNKTEKKQVNKQNFLKKEFIFESFIWQKTSLTLKCTNLNLFCLFVDKKYYKWIIQFIQWIGDLKPIHFSKHIIDYQNYTIEKLILKFDFKRKIKQVAQIILQYPLNQTIEIGSVIFGFNQRSSIEKMYTFFKIFKVVGKIVKSAVFLPTLLNKFNFIEMDADNLSYIQKFEYISQSKQNIIDKIQLFQYAQWKYQQKICEDKFPYQNIQRLQRYNIKNQILGYNQDYSRIKLALDSKLGNKISRKIQFLVEISLKIILGVTQQYIVLYYTQFEEWHVCLHQSLVFLGFLSNNPKYQKLLRMVICGQEWVSLKNEQGKAKTQGKGNRLQTIDIRNPLAQEETIKQVDKYVRENKLIGRF